MNRFENREYKVLSGLSENNPQQLNLTNGAPV